MRDLYLRNHLAPRESDPVKINNCEGGFAEDQEAAFSILLNDERKRVYDQTHQALEIIGFIRGHCDINTKAWSQKNGDFYQTVTTDIPLVPNSDDQKHEKSSAPSSASRKKSGIHFSLFWVPVLAIVVTVGLYFYLNQEHTDEPVAMLERHVVEDDVPVYRMDDKDSQEMTRLSQFKDVQVNPDLRSRGWDYVELGANSGYVESSKLAEGSGYQAMIEACRSLGISRPESGQIAGSAATGTNRLLVSNPPGHDALVKLRNPGRDIVMIFYVRADSHISLEGIPEGPFTVFFATGENFSASCGRFLDHMEAFRDSKKYPFRATEENGVLYPALESFILKTELFGVDRIPAENF